MKQEFFTRKRITGLFFTLIGTVLISGIKELLPVLGITSTTIISLFHYGSIITVCLGIIVFIVLFVKWNVQDLISDLEDKITGLNQEISELKNKDYYGTMDYKITTEKTDILRRMDSVTGNLTQLIQNNDQHKNGQIIDLKRTIKELEDEIKQNSYTEDDRFEMEILRFVLKQRGIMLYLSQGVRFGDGRRDVQFKDYYLEEEKLLQKKYGESEMGRIKTILKQVNPEIVH
jgi:hypothetical protein